MQKDLGNTAQVTIKNFIQATQTLAVTGIIRHHFVVSDLFYPAAKNICFMQTSQWETP